MTSRAFVRPLGVLLVAASVGFLPAWAQDRKEPVQVKHIVHVVKLGSAKDIAVVLSKQFKGEAEADVLPEPNGNCLLIRANAAVFDDVLKVLQALDRRPRLVTVEIWVADVAPAEKVEKGEEPKPVEIDEKSLTGPSGEVMVRLRGLQRTGKLNSLKRIQTTVAENQSGSVTEGETKPVVSGSTITGTGRVSRSITYRNTGTQARCTARVADDKTVTLDLKVEDVRLQQAEDGLVIGENEKKEPIRATEIILASYDGTITLAQGQAVLLRGVETKAKSTRPRTLIVATARVVDDSAKPDKEEDERPKRPIRRPRPLPPEGRGVPEPEKP